MNEKEFEEYLNELLKPVILQMRVAIIQAQKDRMIALIKDWEKIDEKRQ